MSEVKQESQPFYQNQFRYTLLQYQELKRSFSCPLLPSQLRLQSNQLDKCFTELNKDIKKQNEITIK